MLRRKHLYLICFTFGVSILLHVGNPYIYYYNISYHPIQRPKKTPTYIDTILEKTRAKIEKDFQKYDFSYSGGHQLEDLLMEAGGQPIRSLIISTWRSGSTFLAEVLDAMPGNFYHYEPLLKYGIIQIREPPHAAIGTIKNMFKCNFDHMEDYFKYGMKHLNQFMHNTQLWLHCKYMKALCFDANFTARFCKLFPFQSMKVVRARLRLVEELLEDEELKVKIVLLIRDPRAVMESRQHRDFCPPAPDCWDPALLCTDMVSDYVAAGRLLQQFPGRLMVLRYEELALHPYRTVHDLFKFLGLKAMPSVNRYLHKHTNIQAGGVSSTFRVSRGMPFRWRKFVDFKYVDKVQTSCKIAMELWGYLPAYNATHMTSKTFKALQNYSVNRRL